MSVTNCEVDVFTARCCCDPLTWEIRFDWVLLSLKMFHVAGAGNSGMHARNGGSVVVQKPFRLVARRSGYETRNPRLSREKPVFHASGSRFPCPASNSDSYVSFIACVRIDTPEPSIQSKIKTSWTNLFKRLHRNTKNKHKTVQGSCGSRCDLQFSCYGDRVQQVSGLQSPVLPSAFHQHDKYKAAWKE